MNLVYQTYSHFVLASTPIIQTDLLWGLTWLFVGLAIIYFLSVFFLKKNISSRSSRTAQQKMELSPIISEFLFYEEDADKIEKSNYIDLKIKIRELLKDDFNRKLFTEILLDLRKDVSGDTQKRLFKLYKDLSLDKDAFKKLQSWRWEVISKGILELTQMRVEEAYAFIVKFINHKKGTIRKQAEIAAVTLKPEGINYFLDTTRYKISEWQQMKLLDVLRNQEDFNPPRFKNWLTANNKHVVLFALRLIKFYNQNDANASLIELVKHRNSQIRQEAVSCIKEFHVVNALPVLKTVFRKSSVDVKIGILNAIGDLGSESDIQFLKSTAAKQNNFTVKNKALAAINIIAPDTIMPTEGIENVSAFADEPLEEDGVDQLQEEFEDSKTNQGKSDIVPGGGGEKNDQRNQFPAEQLEQSERDRIENQPENDNCIKELEYPIDEASNLDCTSITDVNDFSDIGKSIEVDDLRFFEYSDDGSFDEEMPCCESDDVKYMSMPDYKSAEELSEMEANILEESGFMVNFLFENIATDHSESIAQAPEDIDSEMQQDETTNSEENSETSEQQEIIALDTSTEEIELHLNFLPIVINSASTKNITSSNYKPMKHPKNNPSELAKIEVNFEVVQATTPEEKTSSDTTVFDVSEIAFLPIVVEDDRESENTKSARITISGGLGDSHMSAETNLNGDDLESVDTELHSLIEEVKELDFLPLVTQENPDETITCDIPENYDLPENAKNIEGYTLSDFEVDFDETGGISDNEDTIVIHFDLEATSQTDLEDSAGDDALTWLMIENGFREIEVVYEIVPSNESEDLLSHLIPEPVYYDEHESYMMALLDDLEELGDEREIPLLEEFLVQETKIFIKDRLRSMIAQFTLQSRDGKDGNSHFDTMEEIPTFSVFADLFKAIDVESKLILLDEIVAVGDEKEIDFLDGLLEDPDIKIRKKARLVLKQLIAKVYDDSPKPVQIETSRTQAHVPISEMSDRSFYEYVSDNDDERVLNEEYNGLLHEMEIMPSTDTEIFEIAFEFSESLDKNLSSDILSLQVVATEVPAKENSSLFPFWSFPKKNKK